MRLKLKIEQILFSPKNFLDKTIIVVLSPFSVVYCSVIFFRASFLTYFGSIFYKKLHQNIKNSNLKIIGIGNLTLGGNGKTPLTIKLIEELKTQNSNLKIAILLRGYGRISKGLLIVSQNGKILEDVNNSGDEAFLFAKKLAHLKIAVIVSEDRTLGIQKAIELDTNILFLDDSFSKHHIPKKEILILDNSQNLNKLCLPAGAYREKLWFFKKNILTIQENIDFERIIKIENLTSNMLLITAISKPQRVEKYLKQLEKNIINRVYFEDHYSFTKTEIEKILNSQNKKIDSILTTEKDLVKLENLKLDTVKFSLMRLDLKFKNSRILDFIK